MKKGFTLIELLVTIVIISLLGALGVISLTSIFNVSETKYYDDLESNMLLAGNDYFLDHRDELPNENYVSEVSLSKLIEEKYIEPLKKSNGESCDLGKVYVYRNDSKYQYEACIFCDENHVSKGKYCNGVSINEILVSAKKKDSNTLYNVLSNYNNLDTSNEDIVITVTMKDVDTIISKFEVVNVKTGESLTCNKTGNSTCEVEISVSGTYKITAKTNDGEILTKYINTKIVKENAIIIDKNNLERYCANVIYNGEDQTITIPLHEGLVFTGNNHTNAGNYEVVAHIDAPNYIWNDGSADNEEFTCSIEKITCSSPTNVLINTNGEVTWQESSNCKEATYELRVEDGEYVPSVSGVNKKEDIISSSGDRNVYVKTIAPNENYDDSSDANGLTTVYTVTLTKGTGISAVSGSGKYITGETVTLNATLNSGYKWSKWNVTSDSSMFSTTQAYSEAISSDLTLTAVGAQITYTKKVYNCEIGVYSAGKPVYIAGTSCVPSRTKTQADRGNYGEYQVCKHVQSASCPNNTGQGQTPTCYERTTYTRRRCDSWKSSPEANKTETGLISCTPSTTAYTDTRCIEE